MNSATRELFVYRILSGSLRVQINGKQYLVKKASPDSYYMAQLLYFEELEAASEEGLFDQPSLLQHLMDEGVWDVTKEELYRKIPKDIEDFKVRLFQSTFQSEHAKQIRRALDSARIKLAELEVDLHSMDHLSCHGAALFARNRYLAGAALYYPNGQPVFPDDTSYWSDPSDLLDNVMQEIARGRLQDAQLRELARTDPWRGIWQTRKAQGAVFDGPASSLTDEQRAIISYSLLYDSIYEHPDCPGEEIIEDDDTLDGWLILQRREREKRNKQSAGEGKLSDSTKGCGEVFLMADTPEDARKIMEMNEDHARAIQKSRFAHLQKHGQVNELDMPDTKQRLRMEALQKISKGS